MTGRKLGRFEIIREIGKGAMGVVYLAHDPKIDRKIAIKMISMPAGLSPDEARESGHRFVREAQAAGKLQHPNIITIYDVVEEDGRSYITMEYIDGETLEHYARPGSLLPLSKVLSITAQACAALDYAHKNNVIHRDIKPANLMLVKGELLKITDFGLAKHPEANLTQAGVLIGTPNYMSPEQISGKPSNGRGDFFSLAVVLYELLTGERPFGGDTISTIIYRILYEDPRSPRILNEKLPAAFDGIFRRALAKDPEERYQTGAEFVDALNNYSMGHLRAPVSSAPPTIRAVRGEAPPPPNRARVRPDAARKGRPILAGQPLKAAALTFFGILAILLFPHRVHQDSNAGKEVAPGVVPPVSQDQAGFTGQGPPPGARLAIPFPSAGRQITVKTDRSAAKLFWDNQELNGNVVKLSDSDEGEHTLLAVDGCNEGSILVQGSTTERTLDVQLKPKVADLVIDSKPPRALVYLNDKLMGPTPVTIPQFNACEPATVVLKKENFSEFRRNLDGTSTWSEISGALRSVTLSEIPPGYVKLASRPPYEVEVLNGSRVLAVKEGVLTLPEGHHVLTIRNNAIFLKQSFPVDVTGSKTTSLPITWPGLGTLSVQAEPSNCQIFVDGLLLDFAPITNQSIIAGDHLLRAVPVADPRQAQEKKVHVEPGGTVLEKFTFSF